MIQLSAVAVDPGLLRLETGMRKLMVVLVLAITFNGTLMLPASGEILSEVSDWDWQLPTMELSEVSIEGNSLTEAWKEVVSSLYLRCNLYVGPSPPDQRFSFRAESCTALEVLDALSAHYGYQWAQEVDTGVIWIFPSDRPLDSILDTPIDVADSVTAAPMHSGVIKPLQEALPWGTLFTQAWSDQWLATFDYPVSIAAGQYTVQEILNRCCRWSPKQAFLATEDPVGIYLMDVHLPFDKYPSPAPGALLFWKTEIGPLAENTAPTAEDIGQAIRDPSPKTRWAAQAYLGICLESQGGRNFLYGRVPSLPLGENTAWEALGAAAAQNQRPDKFRIPKPVLTTLSHHASVPAVENLSPDVALLTVMATAAYTKDERILESLAAIDITGVATEQVAFELLRLANFSEIVYRALYDANSPHYIGRSLDSLPQRDPIGLQKLSVHLVANGENSN